MRTILIASLLALGIGLAGTSPGSAAPAMGSGLRDALAQNPLATQAQYYYHKKRYYRPYCYYVTRCSGYYPYQYCWRERVCR